MVKNQWDMLKQLHNTHLLNVLGPLVGNGSDREPKRKKLHLLHANSQEGQRYKLDHENFEISGKVAEVNNKRFAENLADQDYIHNAKKLVNHLKHLSRVISLDGVCHMNHLQFLSDNKQINLLEHGL